MDNVDVVNKVDDREEHHRRKFPSDIALWPETINENIVEYFKVNISRNFEDIENLKIF